MVKNFNFRILDKEIRTQYNDMRGIAAIDGHEPQDLVRMCKDNGIDFEKYFLVGLEFYDGETIGRHPLIVSAYLVERENGDETYDAIAKRLAGMTKVAIHKKSFRMEYEELGHYIKRLSFGVLSSISEYILDAEFEDDVE